MCKRAFSLSYSKHASHKQETLTEETFTYHECWLWSSLAPLWRVTKKWHIQTSRKLFKITLNPQNVICSNLPYYDGQKHQYGCLSESFCFVILLCANFHHSHLTSPPSALYCVSFFISPCRPHPDNVPLLFIPDETPILFDKCTVHHADVFWEVFVAWKVIAYLTVNCVLWFGFCTTSSFSHFN